MNARCKGFTLLEVLVGALLVLASTAALGVCLVSGKHFLKQAELRAQAVDIASSRMRETLAKGYSAVSGDSGQDGIFSWVVNVTNTTTAGGNRADIPYRNISAVVSYDVENNGEIETKNIRLTNILSYPSVHDVLAEPLVENANAKVPWVCSSSSNKCGGTSGGVKVCDGFADRCNKTEEERFDYSSTVGYNDPATIGYAGELLKLEVEYETDRNIEVVYNISMVVSDSGGEIQPTDTVYIACFLDGRLEGMVARVPISTQPSFSGSIVLESVAKNTSHTIKLKWYYNNLYFDDDVENDAAYTNADIHLGSGFLGIRAVEPEV